MPQGAGQSQIDALGEPRVPKLAVNVAAGLNICVMQRFLALAAIVAALLISPLADADPADINAASRGVVRVVIIGEAGGEVYPISHGSGFAVTPTRLSARSIKNVAR